MSVREDLDAGADAALIGELATACGSRYELWPRTDATARARLVQEQIAAAARTQRTFHVRHGGRIAALAAWRELEWDSAHFGLKCAALTLALSDARCEASAVGDAWDEVASAVVGHAARAQAAFVSVSVDSRDAAAAAALQARGFRHVVGWVEGFFAASGAVPRVPARAEYTVSSVQSSDVAPLRALAAAHYFQGGRFFMDRRFDPAAVRRMYGALIENAAADGDVVLVARHGDQPVGCFVCKPVVAHAALGGLRVAPLRFLVVDPRHRDRGLGRLLMTATLDHLRPACDVITTGLECHNLASLNLHARFGFRFSYAHDAYHWWNPQRV
jgi:GNAT superfamily N-acetyltransferase